MPLRTAHCLNAILEDVCMDTWIVCRLCMIRMTPCLMHSRVPTSLFEMPFGGFWQIAAEDPFCGESVIRNIDKPFILLPEEEAEVKSWEL